MKQLVDRWGTARTSMAALTIAAVLGGAAFNLLEDEPGREMMDCARFSRVVLVGFAVAHPDYSVESGNSFPHECLPDPELDDEIPSFDGSLEVSIGPRMAGTLPREQPSLSIEFRQDPSGEIRFPEPDPWYLTEIMTSPESRDAKSENLLTLDTLKGMDWRRHRVHAFVALKNPLNEEEVNEIHAIGLNEMLLLSPGGGEKPFGWPYSFPGVIGGFDVSGGQASTSRVNEFRRWVSLLKAEDGPALKGLGLDLMELQDRAEEGLVHGFTVINTPEAVKRMAKNPKVRSVSVIDVIPENRQ
ncbi:hypothetical protein ACFOWE_29555 [Planomonospora corallina]|uniref:Uncharacterized protein n=1 Tax=Planomonospora corallina TaxID=1806052 RepID=A0ABV8IEC4_9ACTN